MNFGRVRAAYRFRKNRYADHYLGGAAAGGAPSDCQLARSALGPCRNGRARASAVTSGRPRFGGIAGRGPSRSSSRDDADGRFRLWSRRSGVRVPSVTPSSEQRFRASLPSSTGAPGGALSTLRQRAALSGGSSSRISRATTLAASAAVA
jgi:hypothetical protein